MIRIKTAIGTNSVHTLYYSDKWITITHLDGKSTSTDALTLWDAGNNHLAACQLVQGKQGASQ